MSQVYGPVHELLDEAYRRDPAREAVRDATGSWTYAELYDASRRAAGWLARHGVAADTRVVVQARPHRHTAALFYACSRLGAACVPVLPTAAPYHVRHVIADAEPVLVLWDGPTTHGRPAYTTAAPFAGADADPLIWPAPGADGSRPVLLFYTSGSTAQPKAVVCPHRQVGFAVRAIAQRLGYRGDDVVFCRLPLSFDYGFYQILLATHAGATLVLTDTAADARLPAELVRHGATVVPLVPALADMLVRLAGRARHAPPVRLFTNTGEALPDTLIARLRQHFPRARIQLMFGLTECKRVTIIDPDGDRAKPGSVGTALPGTRVDIVDGEGRPVPPGTAGEIVVSGPHVMAGYWAAPELTRRVFRPGPDGTVALFTGDVGHLDEDRHLYFHGRRDQVFKRRGVRTSVQEIEAAALDIPGVREAAVLPPAGDRDLEIVLATELSEPEVLRLLRERLDTAKVPDRCRITARLPRTANGKVDRSGLTAASRS